MPGLRGQKSFNPPPAWSARGTVPGVAQRGTERVSIHPPLGQRGERRRHSTRTAARCFNPPPAWSARGTGATGFCRHRHRVSIHPPLGQRGEPPDSKVSVRVRLKQQKSRTANLAVLLLPANNPTLAAIPYLTMGSAHSRTTRKIGFAWGPRTTRPPVEKPPPHRASPTRVSKNRSDKSAVGGK